MIEEKEITTEHYKKLVKVLGSKNISTENFEAFKTDVKALNMEGLFSRV